MRDIIKQKWGHISYNSDTSSDPFVGIVDEIFAHDAHKKEETAICYDGLYLILYGDWRERLRNKTLEECIEIFLSNPKYHGYSSDKPKTN